MYTSLNSQHGEMVNFLKSPSMYRLFSDHCCYNCDEGKILLRNNLDLKVETECIEEATRVVLI